MLTPEERRRVEQEERKRAAEEYRTKLQKPEERQRFEQDERKRAAEEQYRAELQATAAKGNSNGGIARMTPEPTGGPQIRASNAPLRFFARLPGQVFGIAVALVVRYFAEFFGELASYYSAKAYYDARPQGEWDPSAHLQAVRFSLHDGSDTGRLVGILVYIALFLATSRKWGWKGFVFAFFAAMIAAGAAGYIAGLSPG